MPSALTYPGVYIEEVPSGVRSISGVSTSVTAFIGAAKRGPVNRAVRIQSFAEFERRFGGLDPGSEMSYGVRQFFANGGSDAWVVRVAKGADQAKKELPGADGGGVLRIRARDEGASGNAIQVWVDSSPATPGSFNLTLVYASADNAVENRTETFTGLSMNSQDFRYAVDVVNAGSELVTLERIEESLGDTVAGTSRSGRLVDGGGALVPMDTLVDSAHNQLRVSVNGSAPVAVTLNPATLTGTPAAQLTALCGQIEAAVIAAANGVPALSGFSCDPDGERILMTSGAPGETSSVRVLPGAANDAATRLKLGSANGGVESDGTAPIVPRVTPDPGRLVGAVIPDAAPLTGGTLEISIDGAPFQEVNFAIVGADHDAKAADAATKLQAAVRALKSTPAYTGFTATAGTGGSRRLTLSSGSRGAGSSVAVSAAGNPLAASLGLTTGAATPGVNTVLAGGAEQGFGPDDTEFYKIFVGARNDRKGLYALERVDIFNLLCLPGVTNPGVLADAAAYCQERRAFLIADAKR
ncbi:MAG TPA: hypothetical protein VFQ76_01920, partial [Longimicrobiaceae bacterium]|nr:hypothetical protein [Longimicrobiaceae bacterium]